MVSPKKIPGRNIWNPTESHVKMSRPEHESRASGHMNWTRIEAKGARLATNAIGYPLFPLG